MFHSAINNLWNCQTFLFSSSFLFNFLSVTTHCHYHTTVPVWQNKVFNPFTVCVYIAISSCSEFKVWLFAFFFFLLLLQVKQQFEEHLDQMVYIKSRLVSRNRSRKSKKWRMHQLQPASGARSSPVSYVCEFVQFLRIMFHLILASFNLPQFLQMSHWHCGAR